MLWMNLLEWGVQSIVRFQQWGDWLIIPMNGFTFTGNIEFYLLLLPVIYWTVDRRLGVRVASFLLLSIILNNLCKMLGHSPRPYWYAAQIQLWTVPELSFGLPSGHAQNAVVMWGLFAHYGRRSWGWLVAALLMIMTGLSRIYLGVHFPTDVIAGWLLGLLLLWLGLRWEGAVEAWLKRYRPSPQLVLLFAISAVLTLIGLGVRTLVQAHWSLPVSWIQTAMTVAGVAPAPFLLHDIVTATGALWGLSTGALLCTWRGGFSPQGAGKARLLRFLIGAVGVLLLWRGLDVLFALVAPDESPLGYLLRFLRYTAIGLWVAVLAPLLFIRLRLAKPASISVPGVTG